MNFNDYDELVDLENLLKSWGTYKQGKIKKMEVMEFERHLEDNLFLLHRELKNGNYVHGEYSHFRITDPKKRDIYKSKVRDRIVHQAAYEYLCRVYEPIFIENSFSSRKKKGTHRAVKAVKLMADKVAEKGNCFAMKCDVKKYFENIDHDILLRILKEKICDAKIINLLEKIIRSFAGQTGKGLPLGNITSQVFANVYLDKLDKFVSDELQLDYYVRYNDDFVLLGNNGGEIKNKALQIREFLRKKLKLELPENKTIFRKLKWGLDFCGYIILPNAVILRQKTKKRMFGELKRKHRQLKSGTISQSNYQETINSYFGLLKHCNSHNLKEKIRNNFIYDGIF